MMGQLFQQGGMTTPGSALLNSNGSAAMIGDPSKMRDIDLKTHSQLRPYVPGTPNPNQPLPSVGTPTFQQAASAGATPSGANALSPGLNKAGKLLTLLTSGLQGALAGRAASEQTVAATGGRRSGGAGMGFEAGYELPWQREQKQLGLQQQQAQVEATKAQSQMINTPSGPMPAWLAKAILPAELHKEGTLGAAQTGKEGRLGAADISGQYRMKALAAGTAPITQEDIQQYGLPPEFLGKVIKPSEIAGLQRSQSIQNVPQMTAEGPIVTNRSSAQARPVQGPGGTRYQPPALASPREVADVNNPGQTVTLPAGQTFGKPGVQSASVQVPKKAAAAEVPTKIGDLKVGFTTAISHADLLRQAAKALKNGDQRTLAGLSNRAQTEFGDSDLTNFEAIANAYNHEVTNVIAKGHITDNEVGTGNRTLPSTANYETIDKVLNSYQSLMKSKMENLTKQKNSAVSASQPKSKTGGNEILWHIENGKLVQGAAPK